MLTPQTTRIAPSPTGDFHIGSARTALFCYLGARSTGGTFIERIDDTDVARNNEGSIGAIDGTLQWLGLTPDLRIRQSERLDLYNKVVDLLLKADLARLDGTAVRLSSGPIEQESWTDTLAGKIPITDHDRETAKDLVLIRSDGSPTYHFASIVDDMATDVSWVIRGTDHISNTPKHIAIWDAISKLDWEKASTPMPAWTHVGLITKDKKKLSKRDNAASMLSYRDAGVSPDAMLNFLLRLGWGPSVDDKTTATISRERAVELFLAGGRMRSSPANMDPRLLESLDRKYKGALERASRPVRAMAPGA